MYKKIKLTKNGKIAVVIIGFIVVVFMAVTIYFNNKFYPRTTIGNIDVSGMTANEAKDYIKKCIKDYSLELKGRNDGQYTIKGTDIDLKVEYEDIVDQCMEKSHQGISFYKLLTNNEFDHAFKTTYNDESLKGLLNSSELITGSDNYVISAPENSYVKYDEKTKLGKIVSEKQGNQLDTEQLYKILDDSIKDLAESVDLDKKSAYVKPTIVKDSDTIKNELETYNKYLLKWIKWDMGENHFETITPENIKDWIVINDDGSVDIDKDKMSDWIESFCEKYKTVGKTRSFKSHTGAIVELSGGDYGWQLNYNDTLEDAYNAIKKDTDQSLIDAYKKNNNDTDIEALTTTLEPKWKNFGATLNYDNPTQDWDESNYTEVDIASQMVYVFRNGEVVYSARCVTGMANDPKRMTTKGCWYIKDKKEDYVLVGDDYRTPTKYWIRITWTGIGYHFLERSDWSRWSPEIYKTRGSHGCVNLQMEDAKNIYNFVRMRDIVFIH